MNLEIPTEEELFEYVRELEEQEEIVFPEFLELSKEEFILLFMEAFKKFYEEFPADGYKPLSTFTSNGIELQNASSIILMEDERGEPFLNAKVFRDDNTWVFNGYVNCDRFLGYFSGISLKYLLSSRRNDESITDETFRESLINLTLNVMGMAMRKMPKWIELMIDSFENKIELIWAKHLYEDLKEKHSIIGLQFPKFDLNAHRQKSIRAVESKIREFLQDDTGFDKYLLDLKKKKLAITYENTYSHWESMQELQLKGKNWQRYIQAADMSDVTVDLIEEFISDKKIGDIAIEHAARRAKLFNSGKLTDKNQELREKGIECSGYSRSKLFGFKKEGELLLRKEEENKVQSNAKTNAMD